MPREIEERLRGAGYRVTKQRIAVYEYLLSTDTHPTAEGIYEAVRKEYPQVSLATVYNAVDSLATVGLVRRLSRGLSSTRYDGCLKEHAHFRCIVCDAVRDVSLPNSPAGGDGLDGCEIIGANVEFFGYCPRCRRRKLGLPLLSKESEDRRQKSEEEIRRVGH